MSTRYVLKRLSPQSGPLTGLGSLNLYTLGHAFNSIGTAARNIYNRLQEERRALTSLEVSSSLVENIESAEYSMIMKILQWNGPLALSNLPLIEDISQFLYDQGNTGDINQNITVAMYKLPLPSNLIDSLMQKWQATQVNNTFQSSVQTALSRIPGGRIGGGIVGDLSVLTQVGTGMALNELFTQMFKGPEFKRYSFTWTLSPNTPQIAAEIKKFLRQINKSVAPRKAYSGIIWEYPLIFQLEFHKKNAINPNMYKFKPAVCTNFSVNYAGSGVPTFYPDGQPETVVINMTFTELLYWHRDEFDNW